MMPKLSISLILILSLLGTACSKDPEVAKKEYLAKGNQYFEQQKFPEAIIEYRNAGKAIQRDI